MAEEPIVITDPTTVDPVADPQLQDPTGGDPAPGTVDPDPTADPTPADPGVIDPAADPSKKKDGVQKKIDKLTREKGDATREAAYWKGVADGKKEPEVVKPASTELDPANFETYEDYVQASIKKGIEEGIKGIQEGQKAEKKAETIQTIQKQYGEARKVHEDFNEIALNPALPINQNIMDAAMGDNFAEILYELGKNPEKAAEIAVMSPLQAAREIGKIEARITNPAIKPKPKETNAPPPVPTVGGPSADNVPDDKKSKEQLHAKWEKTRRERMGVK